MSRETDVMRVLLPETTQGRLMQQGNGSGPLVSKPLRAMKNNDKLVAGASRARRARGRL